MTEIIPTKSMTLCDFMTFLKNEDIQFWDDDKIEKTMSELKPIIDFYREIFATWRYIPTEHQSIYDRIQNNFAKKFDVIIEDNELNYIERAIIYYKVSNSDNMDRHTTILVITKNYLIHIK